MHRGAANKMAPAICMAMHMEADNFNVAPRIQRPIPVIMDITPKRHQNVE